MLRLLLTLALLLGCGSDIVLERWQQRLCRHEILSLETLLREQQHARDAARLRYQNAIVHCCFKSTRTGDSVSGRMTGTALARESSGE